MMSGEWNCCFLWAKISTHGILWVCNSYLMGTIQIYPMCMCMCIYIITYIYIYLYIRARYTVYITVSLHIVILRLSQIYPVHNPKSSKTVRVTAAVYVASHTSNLGVPRPPADIASILNFMLMKCPMSQQMKLCQLILLCIDCLYDPFDDWKKVPKTSPKSSKFHDMLQ